MSTRIDPASFGRVAVLMGGSSAEREISLVSGKNILEALLSAGVDAFAIDLHEDIVNTLVSHQFDRAFIAMHGPIGEDGTIQAVLELMDKPYTGSGVTASAIAMDKIRCKALWQGLGIKTPQYLPLNADMSDHDIVKRLGLPLVIKPNYEGSSCGITIVNHEDDLHPARLYALEYDDIIFAERFIKGREFTLGLIGSRLLPSIEIRVGEKFYDFTAKYESDQTQFICPTDLGPQKETELRMLAKQAIQAVGVEGWGRIDLLQDQFGDFWFIDLNPIPGMTSHSLVPTAAKTAGLSFQDLVLAILLQTLEK